MVVVFAYLCFMNQINTLKQAARYSTEAFAAFALATDDDKTMSDRERLLYLWDAMDAAFNAARRLNRLDRCTVTLDKLWFDAETLAVSIENKNNLFA